MAGLTKDLFLLKKSKTFRNNFALKKGISEST